MHGANGSSLFPIERVDQELALMFGLPRFDIGARLNRHILYPGVIYGQVGIAGPFSNRALQHYRAFVSAT